jgi:hypothetical protein
MRLFAQAFAALRSSGGGSGAAVAAAAVDDADMKEEPTGVDAIAQVLTASSVHSAAAAVEVTLHERTQKRSSLSSSTGSLTAAAAAVADGSMHSESGIEMAQRSPQQSDAAAVTPRARGAVVSSAAVAHDTDSNGYTASSQQQREYNDVEAAFGTAAVQRSSAPASPRRAMHRASISHQFLNLLGRSKHGPDAAARKAALPHSTVHGQSSISRVNSERSSAGGGASGWGSGRVGWGSQHHLQQQQQQQQPAVVSLAGEGKAAAAVRRRHLHHRHAAATGGDDSSDEAGGGGPDVITVVNHHWEVRLHMLKINHSHMRRLVRSVVCCCVLVSDKH